MIKAKYRSAFGTVYDIVSIIADAGGGVQVIISEIARKAGLSHYAVMDKLKPLVENGIIIEGNGSDGLNHTFKATPKTYEFLRECNKLRDYLEKNNLLEFFGTNMREK